MPRPYRKEFEDLFLNNPLNRQANGIGIDPQTLVGQLSTGKCTQTSSWLQDLYKDLTSREDFSPLHIGLGNPNARILVVGHELAIDVNKADPKRLDATPCREAFSYYRKLYVNEVILNYFLWWCKVQGMNIPPNCCLQDPEFPQSFCHLYNQEKSLNHNWGYLHHCMKTLWPEIDFRATELQHSFFKEAFLTELNAIPAPRSNNPLDGSAIKRQFASLTTEPFYKSFSRIIFSCHSYLNKHLAGNGLHWRQMIETAYNVQDVSGCYRAAVRGNNNIKAVFESNDPQERKRIIVTNHIGGAARGWFSATKGVDDLALLANLLKNE